MADFNQRIVTGLQSDDPHEQAYAIQLLQRLNTPLSAADWSCLSPALVGFFAKQCTPETMQALTNCLFTHTAATFAAQAASPGKLPAAIHVPGSLVRWLFKPFFRKSLMLSIMSANGLARDESAVGLMSRLLSWQDFPETTFQKCRILSRDWLNYLWNPEYHTVGFFGRLPLYGPDVAADYDNPALRFLPSDMPRYKGLRHRQIDPAYHCAHEQIAGRLRCTYTTHLESRSPRKRYRVDYGFIQRYVVKPGGNKITVFRCWGPSSLGTEGAALWASANLPKLLTGHPGSPIMLPETLDNELSIDSDTPFEAFIEVKAEETRASWGAIGVDLKRLYVGPYAWDKETRSWSNATPTEIRVRYEGNTPVKVLFDGQETNLQVGNENVRVLVTAIEYAVKNPRREFDIQAIASRCGILGSGPALEDKVRGHINTLKHRYIHTLENRPNQQPRFLCDLVLERFDGCEVYPAPDLPTTSAPVAIATPSPRVARPRRTK